ncbi:MAG: hypothetical protein NVV67_03495 [Pseudoxanthomonas sp.]|nr:hypothetical protein [Pseudoxanthomonas sp.]
MEAYVSAFGSMDEALSKKRTAAQAPYRLSSSDYRGKFQETTDRLGITNLLFDWGSRDPEKELYVTALSSFLTMAANISVAFIASFTGMRIQETLQLSSDCLIIENDRNLGPIHLIKGPTTKTVKDRGALWVTSQTVSLAVRVLRSVSSLRLEVLRRSSEFNAPDLDDIPLRIRATEPWVHGAKRNSVLLGIDPPQYADWRSWAPRLFDPEVIRITKEDLDLARLITPSLNPKIFKEGREWHLTWHQLRRTIAVNMTGSGLVSDATLQYQLKHLCRAMSLYYSRGFSHLKLNREVQAEYIRSVYEVLNLQLRRLASDQFISPYGQAHKENLLRALPPAQVNELARRGASAGVPCRTTVLGVCLKAGPCPYGGIETIIECGGGRTGKPCSDGLIDRAKSHSLKNLGDLLQRELLHTDPSSPEHESLRAQIRSLDSTIETIRNDEH